MSDNESDDERLKKKEGEKVSFWSIFKFCQSPDPIFDARSMKNGPLRQLACG